MTADRFEQDLRTVLREHLPDEAPLALRLRVAGITREVVAARPATVLRPRRLAWILLAAAVLLAAVAASAILFASRPDSRHPQSLTPSGIAVLATDGDYDDMVADVDGTLWAVGSGSLTHFDPTRGTAQTWTAADDAAFHGFAAGWWSDYPATLVPSRTGGVWLIGDRAVRLFDGDAFLDVVDAPAGIHEATEAPDGSLWVATEHGDVLRWDGSSWASLPDPLPGADGPVSAIMVGPDGQAWVGGDSWASSWDGSSWTTVGADTPLFDREVVAFDPAPDGGVWVVTSTSVAHLAGSAWTLHASAPWGEAIATSAARGPDGALWVSGWAGMLASKGFVSRSDGRSWVTYGAADGIASRVMAVVATITGTYALTGGAIHESHEVPRPGATDGYPRRQWRPVWPPEEPSGAGLAAARLLVVSRDELWAAAEDGIWHFTSGAWANDRPVHADGLRSDLAVAPDGTLWTAGPDGIAYRKDGQWQTVDETAARAVTIDAEGTVWAGVGNDTWRLRPDGAAWSREILPRSPLPPESDTFPDRDLSLAVDGSAVLWAGAIGRRYPGGGNEDVPGGLACFDGHAWETVTEIEGYVLYAARVLGTGPDGEVQVEGWVRATEEQSAVDSDPVHLLLASFDGTDWTVLEAPDGACGLGIGADGSAWASTPRGPAVSDGRGWTFPYPSHALGCSYDADGIAVAPDGTLFVAHDRGIWRFAALTTPSP